MPRYAKQVQPVLIDKKEALFFILHYYKAYPTLQNLGMYFGISDAAASVYIDLLKPCLRAALSQQEAENSLLAKNQEAIDKQFARITDLVIDITEVPIERAVNQEAQKEHYSGKKNSTR